MAWLSDIGVGRLNEVTLRQARLLRRGLPFAGMPSSYISATQANSASCSQRAVKWVSAKVQRQCSAAGKATVGLASRGSQTVIYLPTGSVV